MGQFSEVWEGIWNGTTPVAVKVPKPEKPSNEFLQEANIMKKIQHPKLLQLYAVCTKDEPVYIVTELMKPGDLLDYLRGDGRSLKLPQLIDMAAQVANGMAYLEENKYIHLDLAGRNILVGDSNVTKVAGFGQVKVLEQDFYELPERYKFPIKWTAPEAILNNHFSIQGDVWSFGIVLYEIITYGHFPYPGMTNAEVLEKVVTGYHMPLPQGCPKALYNIMVECWREESSNRPTFKNLQLHLEEFFTAEVDDAGYQIVY